MTENTHTCLPTEGKFLNSVLITGETVFGLFLYNNLIL